MLIPQLLSVLMGLKQTFAASSVCNFVKNKDKNIIFEHPKFVYLIALKVVLHNLILKASERVFT